MTGTVTGEWVTGRVSSALLGAAWFDKPKKSSVCCLGLLLLRVLTQPQASTTAPASLLSPGISLRVPLHHTPSIVEEVMGHAWGEAESERSCMACCHLDSLVGECCDTWDPVSLSCWMLAQECEAKCVFKHTLSSSLPPQSA